MYFIEEVDDDTFEFPTIPNQAKQGGSNKLAIKFLSRLAKVFNMKVVTLYKMKKFVLLGAMRTARCPCFVTEDHRSSVKEILKEWQQIKNPQEAPRESRGEGSGSGGGKSGRSEKEDGSSSRGDHSKGKKKAGKPKPVHFVQSETARTLAQENEQETLEVIDTRLPVLLFLPQGGRGSGG